MSQTDDHWREPPTDRVDPDYPPHLTERYVHVKNDGEVYIYDEANHEAWIQSEGIELGAMV